MAGGILQGKGNDGEARPIGAVGGAAKVIDRAGHALLGQRLDDLLLEVRLLRLGMTAAGTCKEIDPKDAR